MRRCMFSDEYHFLSWNTPIYCCTLNLEPFWLAASGMWTRWEQSRSDLLSTSFIHPKVIWVKRYKSYLWYHTNCIYIIPNQIPLQIITTIIIIVSVATTAVQRLMPSIFHWNYRRFNREAGNPLWLALSRPLHLRLSAIIVAMWKCRFRANEGRDLVRERIRADVFDFVALPTTVTGARYDGQREPEDTSLYSDSYRPVSNAIAPKYPLRWYLFLCKS